MKLGLWNRLAIVGAVLLTFGGSTWTVLSENLRVSEKQNAGYEACLKGQVISVADCGNIWLNNPDVYLGWRSWFEGLAFFAAASVILYLIIWAAVLATKWVWRGRLAPD